LLHLEASNKIVDDELFYSRSHIVQETPRSGSLYCNFKTLLSSLAFFLPWMTNSWHFHYIKLVEVLFSSIGHVINMSIPHSL
jgi:hypothetical protein